MYDDQAALLQAQSVQFMATGEVCVSVHGHQLAHSRVESSDGDTTIEASIFRTPHGRFVVCRRRTESGQCLFMISIVETPEALVAQMLPAERLDIAIDYGALGQAASCDPAIAAFMLERLANTLV